MPVSNWPRALVARCSICNHTPLSHPEQRRALTEDVQLISDGGDKAMVALNPIVGRDKVLRLLEGIARKFGNTIPERWRLCELKGLSAVLYTAEDGILQATSLEVRKGQILRIYATRNPDKTGHLADVLG